MVYEQGADAAAARSAVEAAGGEVVQENLAVGVATVLSDAADFAARARAQGELFGAASNDAIGQTPELRPKLDEERLSSSERAQRGAKPQPVARAIRSRHGSGTWR